MIIDFINKNIDKKVKLHSLKKINTPTIIKKRFLDDVDGKKILGVYDLNDDNLSKEEKGMITVLKDGSTLGIEELMEKSSLTFSQVSSALSMLEINGLIMKRTDGRFEIK